MKMAIGIDIGGTKVAAGIISETGELLKRAEVKSDPSDREKMFSKVVEAVEQVLEDSIYSLADMEGIGVGVPGKVDLEQGIAVFKIIYHGPSFLSLPGYGSNLDSSGLRSTMMYTWRPLPSGRRPRQKAMKRLST